MIKLYSVPGRVVQKRLTVNGKPKIVALFKFDANGEVVIDETKFNQTDLNSLKQKFRHDKEVVVENSTIEPIEYTEEQLRSMAKEQKIKSWHVKSIETLKEELGV